LTARPLAFALLVVAVAAPAARADTLTIKVSSVTVAVKSKDVHPKGTSKGDKVEYRDRLVNVAPQFGRPKGAVVGSDHGTMTFTSASTATFSGVAVLPDGKVTLRGRVTALAKNVIVIPVTGGTGRYANAHGYVLVGPGIKQALNTYTITVAGTPVA
jgi:hypothetical protein